MRSLFIAVLALSMVACTDIDIVLPDTLSVGGPERSFSLAALQGSVPSSRTFRLSLTANEAVQLRAESSLGQASRIQLTLLNQDQVPLARAVSRNWFGIPQVALSAVTASNVYRLNVQGRVGEVYYVRVENLAGAADQIKLSAIAFSPNPNGNNTAFSAGTVSGAIEFLGDFDSYNIAGASSSAKLVLDYSGPVDMVALVYTGTTNPLILEPIAGFNCVAVGGATQVVVRDRSSGSTVPGGGARAGFNETGSGRYTLRLQAECP